DRDAHEIVGDAELRAALIGHREVGHRRRVAGERLGAAEAYRELGHPERVEEAEALGLAALDEPAERAARAGAVAVVDVLLPSVPEQAEKPDALDLRVILEEIAHLDGVLARALHADSERLEAAQQHPGGVGIADAAHRVAQRADRIHPLLGPG